MSDYDKDENERLYDLYDDATEEEREQIDRGFSTDKDDQSEQGCIGLESGLHSKSWVK